MSERHCLKCKHCFISEGSPGYSEMTPGTDPDMRCWKGHWNLDPLDNFTRRDMWEAFEKAKTCRDYAEDPTAST